MIDEIFESRILRFEQSWLRQGRAEIEDVLDDLPAHERHRLLIELICVDLEFRWRSSDPRRPVLEEYVARFPELGALDQLPIELIGEEYRVRRRWGDRPAHDAFAARFQARRDSIRAELIRVDRELEVESAVFREHWQPTPGLDRSANGLSPVPAMPMLSHREFLLKRLLGAGGMGKVYLATQRDNEQEVAVKFPRKAFLRHPDSVERFVREAGTIAKLNHPNIVATQGLGRTPAGAYFIVMDLVKGSNLAVLTNRKAVEVTKAVRWMIAACDALEHAHARGVVHCDLKPANFLLDEAGTIRLADFGFARSLAGGTRWTAQIEGTAPFMAPEQASDGWGPVDERTDIYGLGAVLFALLAGRPPHSGRTVPDVLAQVASGKPIEALARLRPDLPASVCHICQTCLAKPPHARFASMAALRAALTNIDVDGVS